MYGGAALNAFHALHARARRGPARPGRPPARAAARRRRAAVAERDRELGDAAATAPSELAEVGARPADADRRGRVLRAHDGRAVARRPPHRGRRGAHDRRAGGRAPTCRCGSSAASDPDEIARSLEALLRDALPDGAELSFSAERAEPSRVRSRRRPRCGSPARALARACGREPALVRSGGTLPILAAFAERGIPAIVSGFALPEDALHAPERVVPARRRSSRARASARALYEDLGAGLARGS